MLEAEVVDAGVQHSVRADGGVAAGVARPPPRHEGGQGLGEEDLQSTEQCISTIYYCTALLYTVHSSSKATKNESSCPDEIPLQMLPMGIWGPENMKIENI